MQYTIRPMKQAEYVQLGNFLYEAIYVPEGMAPPPRKVIEAPALQIYIRDFGQQAHDRAFVAETSGSVVGAAWVRIMQDYGHIDDETPSLAIAVYKEYRGKGIGTALLRGLMSSLAENVYTAVSLSVQKDNAAVRLYERLGFEIFTENAEEYLMKAQLTG